MERLRIDWLKIDELNKILVKNTRRSPGRVGLMLGELMEGISEPEPFSADG